MWGTGWVYAVLENLFFTFTYTYRTAFSSTFSTHLQDKILIFLSNRTSTHFMGLHLSCFNIHLAYCCFIITIIPTRLSENWFYATRLNERRKNSLRRLKKKNRKGNDEQVRWRCKWKIYLGLLQCTVYMNKNRMEFIFSGLFVIGNGAEENT